MKRKDFLRILDGEAPPKFLNGFTVENKKGVKNETLQKQEKQKTILSI